METGGHRRLMRKFSSESFSQLPIIRRSLSKNGVSVVESRGYNDYDDVPMASPPQSPTFEGGVTGSTSETLITESTSDFDIRRIPSDEIFRRTLYPYSVHHSADKWTATISRPDPLQPTRIRHLVFDFCSEREAHKFCKSYTPPKLRTKVVDNSNNSVVVTNNGCMICAANMSYVRNCRNCGTPICDTCCRRWGYKMIPKTYLSFSNQSTPQTIRVCKSCDWLSNAFCMALLQGRYQDVLTIHDTGNVNLRTCFADIHKEAMFPVHCAVLGGNLDIVKWLVETNCCPISVVKVPNAQPKSVQTSASRTLLDLAMTGKPKIDILVYLVSKGLTIDDVKDTALVPKTLEAVLKTGVLIHLSTLQLKENSMANLIEMDCALSTFDESTSMLEDRCSLCCEQPLDCVLVPCGHQLCCVDCGKQLQTCPICKVSCTVLRVFRQ